MKLNVYSLPPRGSMTPRTSGMNQIVTINFISKFCRKRRDTSVQIKRNQVQHSFCLFLSGSCEPVLSFHFRQVCFLLVGVELFKCFVGLVVEHDEVSIANVEAAEMITSVFGVENIFVNDKSGAASFWSVAAKKVVNIM